MNPVKISDSVRQSNSDTNLCENAHSVRKNALMTESAKNDRGPIK